MKKGWSIMLPALSFTFYITPPCTGTQVIYYDSFRYTGFVWELIPCTNRSQHSVSGHYLPTSKNGRCGCCCFKVYLRKRVNSIFGMFMESWILRVYCKVSETRIIRVSCEVSEARSIRDSMNRPKIEFIAYVNILL